MFKSYTNHRQIRLLGGSNSGDGAYGISLPKRVVEDLRKSHNLDETFFKISYDNQNKIIIIASGCKPNEIKNG